MSENKHTPEPWDFGEDNDGWYLSCSDDQIAFGMAAQDARRIVACVNACKGIPNWVLMTVGAFGGFGRDQMVEHVTKQRDILLAALEKLERRMTACAEYAEGAAHHSIVSWLDIIVEAKASCGAPAENGKNEGGSA